MGGVRFMGTWSRPLSCVCLGLSWRTRSVPAGQRQPLRCLLPDLTLLPGGQGPVAGHSPGAWHQSRAQALQPAPGLLAMLRPSALRLQADHTASEAPMSSPRRPDAAATACRAHSTGLPAPALNPQPSGPRLSQGRLGVGPIRCEHGVLPPPPCTVAPWSHLRVQKPLPTAPHQCQKRGAWDKSGRQAGGDQASTGRWCPQSPAARHTPDSHLLSVGWWGWDGRVFLGNWCGAGSGTTK